MATLYEGRHFANGFSQSELFFQLQMPAYYGGGHFEGTHLQDGVQSSMAYSISLNRLQGGLLNATLVLHICEVVLVMTVQ